MNVEFKIVSRTIVSLTARFTLFACRGPSPGPAASRRRASVGWSAHCRRIRRDSATLVCRRWFRPPPLWYRTNARARARNSQHVFKMWTCPWPWPPAGYVTCSCRNGKLCTQHRWVTPPPPCARASPPPCARATPARAARIRSALKFQLGVASKLISTKAKPMADIGQPGRQMPTWAAAEGGASRSGSQ